VWRLAGVFIVFGIAGSFAGTRASRALGGRKGQLNTIFAGFVMLVALYVLYRSWAALTS